MTALLWDNPRLALRRQLPGYLYANLRAHETPQIQVEHAHVTTILSLQFLTCQLLQEIEHQHSQARESEIRQGW